METIRAFLNPVKPSTTLDSDARNQMASAMHEEYAGKAREDLYKKCKNAAPWEQLDETFKSSNFGMIDHIEDKLKRVNLSLQKAEKPKKFRFTKKQINELAEMEHGRWVVDRLEDGWTLGDRNDEEKKRPQLIPWDQLSQSEKNKDIRFVEELPAKLAEVGYEIYTIDTILADRNSAH